jgi:hypothetical protein
LHYSSGKGKDGRDQIESRLYKKTGVVKFLADLLAGRMDGGKFTIEEFLEEIPRFVQF